MKATRRTCSTGLVLAGLGVPLLLAGAAGVAGAAPSHPGRVGGPASPAGKPSYVLPSAFSINAAAESVTLPMFRGRTATGGATWYVITESSNARDAKTRGVNYAPKLANALGTRAVQRGRWEGRTLVFSGTVDFRPRHVLIPGPHGFPPRVARPGAVGDARYSPLVSTDSKTVLNATQIANGTGRSDQVRSIDPARHRVTLGLFAGFVDGQRNFYLHDDASLALLAGIEDSTYAPNLNAAPGLGSDAPRSARAAIIPIINGPSGAFNPQRQGLNSALLGQGDPLNIEQEQPSDPVHYSPIWDVTPAVWTAAAIAAGQRHRLTSADAVAAAFAAGQLTSFGTGPANPSLDGLRAAGFISNCPIVEVLH